MITHAFQDEIMGIFMGRTPLFSKEQHPALKPPSFGVKPDLDRCSVLELPVLDAKKPN